MKQYPSIPKKPVGESTVFWAFDKIDGSNIRAEWTKKKGFCKFGSRHRLLGTDQGVLAKAEPLAKLQEDKFSFYFKKMRIDKATVFFEFHGPNSFAGNHLETDEHQLSLIDVDIAGNGLIDPKDFNEIFEMAEFNTAKLLYIGPIDEVFVKQVRNGTLKGMTFEGVVCKARRNKRFEEATMFKIKNDAWITKVKSSFDPSLWETLL